jgi:hypothetical protein
MRYDLLLKDTLYFRDHFPAGNYDAFVLESLKEKPEELESFLEKGWEKESGTKLNFFEALAWLRMEDIIEYKGFKSYSINEHDSEYTYDSAEFQDWVSDDWGNFCIDRHASAVYNLPIRIVQKIGMFSNQKERQVEYVLDYINKFTESNNE